MSHSEAAHRRVTLVEGLSPVPTTRAPDPPPPRDGVGRDRLLDVFADLTARVRTGAVDCADQDGVLLDTVIGDFRILVVEHAPVRLVELSPRERQIALMVARGRTNQAIASALEISVWTVSTHVRRIFAKLAVSSRAEMVAHLLAQADFALQVDQLSGE